MNAADPHTSWKTQLLQDAAPDLSNFRIAHRPDRNHSRRICKQQPRLSIFQKWAQQPARVMVIGSPGCSATLARGFGNASGKGAMS